MRGYSKVMAALGIIVGSLLGQPQMAAAAQHPVTAIDILLDVDAMMMERSAAANARLLKVFPKGFTLDAAHHPHISLLQLSTSARRTSRKFTPQPESIGQGEGGRLGKAGSIQVLLHPRRKKTASRALSSSRPTTSSGCSRA